MGDRGGARLRRYQCVVRLVLGLCILMAAPAASAWLWAVMPSGLLEIHYINVQQGSSILVIGPDGTTVLIEAGNNGKGSSEVIPYLESIGLVPQDGLDYTIAGHLDADHVGGFDEVFEAGYDVRVKNYFNGSSHPTLTAADYKAACAATAAGGPEKVPLGQVIGLGGGATLTVVAVAGEVIGFGHVQGAENNENDLTVAALIRFGSFDYLWASDLGGGDEDEACTGRSTNQVNLETPLAQALTSGGTAPVLSADGVDVLHVNHHGGESSTNSDWMNLLRPEVAIISVGAGQGGNFHHPRQAVVESVLGALAPCITAPPALVLQTEEGAPLGSNTSFAAYSVGDIKVTSDGLNSYRIEATGAVSQGPDERALVRLPRVVSLKTHELYFAHFGNGDGTSSDMVLANPSSTATVSGAVQFLSDDGLPLAVGIKTAAEPGLPQTVPLLMSEVRSSVDFSVAPLGSATMSTDGMGELVAGAAIVTSDGRLGGVIHFTVPETGTAVVGAGELLDGFITPVRRKEGAVNTGIAVHNGGIIPVALRLELRSREGQEMASSSIPEFAAGAHLARFIGELFPNVDSLDLDGTLVVRVEGGKVAATVLVLGPEAGQFASLPVIPLR